MSARTIGSAVITLGFLLWISHFMPSGLRTVPEPDNVSRATRQRVVIFLVDTTDYFDAHGTYVHSVIRQYCAQCEVQPVNLSGDLSLPNLVQALQHMQTVRHTYDASTTLLVNLSLGTYTYDEAFHALVRALYAQGIIIIASAGNDNTSKPFYPAAFREVLGVCSSTRYSKTKADYSNFGDWVSLCAPGLQYVTRPLQHGEVASGTSFASPMVAGVLGHLLLTAPCATPHDGRKALLRTADPVPPGSPHLGAGVLNPDRAAQYLRTLPSCQQAASLWQWVGQRVKRLSTQLGISLGLIMYFFVSIFTVPFILAFVIEKAQRRAEQRQQQRIAQVYAGSAAYRQQRLLAIKQDTAQRQRLRRRHRVELLALLHALHLYGEPCWWCGQPEADSPGEHDMEQELVGCSRCSLEPDELLSCISLEPP